MFFLGFYKNGKLKNLANTFICKNGYNKYFSNWWPTRNGLITSIWSSSRISKMKKISKYRIHKNKDIYIYILWSHHFMFLSKRVEYTFKSNHFLFSLPSRENLLPWSRPTFGRTFPAGKKQEVTNCVPIRKNVWNTWIGNISHSS